MIKTVVNILAALTLVGDVLVGVTILLIFLTAFKISYLKQIKKVVAPFSYYFVFIISLIATLGSLFFSEVAHYNPCVLCWYQRIFMYPQPLLLYMAFMRIEKTLTPYLILLNSVGAIIALYHYTIQRNPALSLVPCKAGEVSCVFVPTFHYGYISIPMMALTAFVMNLLLLTIFNENLRPRKK